MIILVTCIASEQVSNLAIIIMQTMSNMYINSCLCKNNIDGGEHGLVDRVLT